jgi:hypothetical protein
LRNSSFFPADRSISGRQESDDIEWQRGRKASLPASEADLSATPHACLLEIAGRQPIAAFLFDAAVVSANRNELFSHWVTRRTGTRDITQVTFVTPAGSGQR